MRSLLVYALPAAAIIFAAIIVGADHLFLRGPDFVVALNGKLSQTQLKSIDLLAELTKLVITVTVGVLGLIVYHLKEDKENSNLNDTLLLTSIFISSCFGLGSIYFGHRVISSMVEMLANDYFALTSAAVARAVVFQYIFLCISVIFAIIFVLLKRAPKHKDELPDTDVEQ